MQLAGVSAFTVAPALLEALREAEEPEAKVAEMSLFKDQARVAEQEMERTTFVNDEGKFREAFTKRDGGKGQVKTRQVCMLVHYSSRDLLMKPGRQSIFSVNIRSRQRHS